MENAQMIGLSRQAVLQRQLDVIANNLANLNTAGFRAQHLRFEQYLTPGGGGSSADGGGQVAYVRDGGAINEFESGAIVQTGNDLDVAIDGDAWFVVNTPEGERYTRNGAFRLDASGNLVNVDGHQVMGEDGPITLGIADTDITITSEGAISSAAGRKGTLKLVSFEQPETLQRVGETLFAGENPQPAAGSRVVQGATEGSNVKAVVEIAMMVEVTRAYTNVSKMLSDTDQMRNDAINQLGQLKS